MRGLSFEKLNITDVTLNAVVQKGMDTHAVREFYKALLELGVEYVQIPFCALDMLNGVLRPARTVLEIPFGQTDIPAGFGGYIGAVSEAVERRVCEVIIGGNSDSADEVRHVTDAALFHQEYAEVFDVLISDPRSSLCVRNAQEFGTALTTEWALAGGQSMTASFLGEGGYAPLEEVLATLHVCGYSLGQMRMEELRRVAETFERMTGRAIPAHKAVVGSCLFDVESGVHVDGIAKNRQCYEPFSPETVGAMRRIVIGKHSGKRALTLKLEELGLSSDCDLERLLVLIRETSVETGGAIDDEMFSTLVQRVLEDDAA